MVDGDSGVSCTDDKDEQFVGMHFSISSRKAWLTRSIIVYRTASMSNDVNYSNNDNDFVMTFTLIIDKSYEFNNFYIQYITIHADDCQDIGPESIM